MMTIENSNNISIGFGAGRNITLGSDNFLCGKNAGANLTTGCRCLIIGDDIQAPAEDSCDFIYIEGITDPVMIKEAAMGFRNFARMFRECIFAMHGAQAEFYAKLNRGLSEPNRQGDDDGIPK